MPPGATTEPVDAMALTTIDASIDARRHERERWTPGRRVSSATPHSPTKRPLGLPTWSDQVRQEVIRLWVAADDDPPCSPRSHGVRPGRGCHTALGEITRGWNGGTWCMEGDIAPGFDRLDHAVVGALLGERFHEQRFLRVIAPRLTAGSLAAWRDQTTRSGGPPGGGGSPLLRHLDRERVARVVETGRRPADHDGQRRRPYPPYMALLNGARNHRRAGTPRGAKAGRRPAQRRPSRDPSAPPVRRLWDGRDADDGRLGCRGPRAEADTSKGPRGEYGRETRHRTRAPTDTWITNAPTEAARFLGEESVAQHADDPPSRA